LIPALGGRTAVLERATKALANDPRWAAQLATYLLLNDDEDADARALRQQAFQGVAATTISTNQRNYLLGIIREERGEIDFTRDLAALNRQTFNRFTNFELLRRLKYRFRAEDADDVNLSSIVTVDNNRHTDARRRGRRCAFAVTRGSARCRDACSGPERHRRLGSGRGRDAGGLDRVEDRPA